MVHRRQEQLVVLSQLPFQNLLQLLQVAALRVRVVAHHHAATERQRVQKAMMTHLARNVQIGVHSLRVISSRDCTDKTESPAPAQIATERMGVCRG